jgi:hypothetical protein
MRPESANGRCDQRAQADDALPEHQRRHNLEPLNTKSHGDQHSGVEVVPHHPCRSDAVERRTGGFDGQEGWNPRRPGLEAGGDAAVCESRGSKTQNQRNGAS